MGKLHKKTKISLVLLFIVPIIISTIGLTIYGVNVERIVNAELYIQGEIVILKDEDFTERFNLPGSGTKKDPYLISNRNFTQFDKVAIVIRDTTKHFLITNCSIRRDGQPIFINNIGFDTGKVINNTFIMDWSLETYVMFEYKTDAFSYPYWTPYNREFIYFNNAPGIRIENNQFRTINNSTEPYRCGLSVISSDYSIISNNTISVFRIGIVSYESRFLTIKNNNCFKNRVGIILEYVSESSILQNKLYNNIDGVFLEEVKSTSFLGNYFENNTNAGIEIGTVLSYSQIRNNYFYKNSYGILGRTDCCNITFNSFNLNVDYAIYLERSINFNSNHIHHNAFIQNNLGGARQAFDHNSDIEIPNYWYDKVLLEGNYWSDLVWNEYVTYIIDSGDSIDLYPLFEPPSLLQMEVLH